MKRRLLSIALVLLMISSMTVGVMAETVTEETINHEDGSVSQVTTTESDTDNPKKIVTVTITTTAPDEDGNYTETTVEEGSEITEKDGDMVLELPEELKLQVTLSPDGTKETPVEDSVSGTIENKTGDLPEGEDDKEYDYTETKSEIDRSMTAENSKVTASIVEAGTAKLESTIKPRDYEGKNKDHLLLTPAPGAFNDYADTVAKPEVPGYDFQVTGWGDATNNRKVMRTKYVNGVATEHKLDNTPMHIALRNGEDYFYGYCIDSNTEVKEGVWYKIANLEDMDYYPSEESAEKLRAIVNHGYWGTATGEGSVDQIRQMMSDYYGEDAVVIVQDAEGKDVPYKISDILAGLSEAEALTATQAAIWTHANGNTAETTGNGYVVEKPASAKLNSGGGSYSQDFSYLDSDARMKAMMDWLLSLEGEKADTGSVVINEENYVESISLTVGGKISDEIDDRDIYETDLNFTLAFVPGEKDGLLIKLLDANGDPIKDKDGKEVIKRLSGENAEGEDYETIAAENGVYTVTGLALTEDSDMEFDLRLVGTQILEEDVYVYSAYGGTDNGQSVVGIASGSRDVEVSAKMTISFSVDETEEIREERHWRSERITVYENDPPVDPQDPPVNPQNPPVDPQDPPVEELPDPEVPLEELPEEAVPMDDLTEIFEEEVPLASVPMTGDCSLLFIGMSILSGTGLAGLALTKKREDGE